MRTIAVGADVDVERGVVGVDQRSAVAEGLRDGAAGGIDGAGQPGKVFVNEQAPVVAVVIVHQPLRVVRTDDRRVDADAREVLVPVLDDQVAGGGIDVDLLATAAVRAVADSTAPRIVE